MRLIDADKFIEYLGLDAENSREENLGEIVILEDFDRQEIIDAEPVRHGKWIYGEDVDIQCSVCGMDACLGLDYVQIKTAYCPHCGAKMDNVQEY